jgi:hypothetical protein
MFRQNWDDFDGVDAPAWLTEEQAEKFCSLLNAYIPKEYSSRGTRYHMLNRYQGGLYFHLIRRS